MADFDVNGARKAGYSDDEILSHLTDTRKFDVAGAVKAGYSKPDIIQHLASTPQKSVGSDVLDSIAEFGKGLIVDTAKSLGGMAQRIAMPPEDMRGKIARLVAGPLGPLITDVVKSHIDTGAKAVDAFKKGRYTEGVGYGAATLLPGVGPAAASAAETIAGAPPEFDNKGNITRPEQPPQVARGLGQATGLVGQVAAAAPINRLAKRVIGPGVTPEVPGGPGAPPEAPVAPPSDGGGLIKSQLNPKQQAGVDYLESEGVPVNAGTRTGNKFLKGAQALAQNQPLGASTAMAAQRATETGLQDLSGRLAEKASPLPETPESAGAAVPAALGKSIENLGDQADEGYQRAWAARDNPDHTYELPLRIADDGSQVMGQVNMPVDVRDIKYLAQPVFDEMQWMPASDRASSAGYQALKKILEGDDFIPAWQAERGLSGLKTMARTDNKSGVRTVSQGIGANLIPQLQENIDASVASTGEDALGGLQAGRAAHAGKMEIADLAEQLRDEPVQTFQKLTWKNDTGIDFLRKIADQAPETMPRVGRAYVQQLFDRAQEEGGFGRARSLFQKWQDLGPETKKILFPSEELRGNLDNFFQGAAMVAENPNPSGTAVVGSLIPGGLLMIHNPISGAAWLLGGYAAAKLMFDPRGVKLLTGGLKSASPGAAALDATRIMGMVGEDGRSDVQEIPQMPGSSPGNGLLDRLRNFLGDEEGSFPSKSWKLGTKLEEVKPFTREKGEPKILTGAVVHYLENQVKKYQGAIDPDAPPSVKFRRVLRYARTELEDQMRQPEPNLDFYTRDTAIADKDMAKAYPELATDSSKHAIQKVFSAALSPGQKPNQEAFYGGQVYGKYRDSGRIQIYQDSGKAWPSQGATKALKKIQGYLDLFGGGERGEQELVKYLLDEHTIGELRKINKSVGGRRENMGFGNLILGPKVGRYFYDLMGIPQEATTVDLWATRANQRRLGYMFNDTGKMIEAPQKISDRQVFMDTDAKLADEFGITRNEAQSGLWHYEQDLYRRLGLSVKSFKRSQGTERLLQSLGKER